MLNTVRLDEDTRAKAGRRGLIAALTGGLDADRVSGTGVNAPVDCGDILRRRASVLLILVLALTGTGSGAGAATVA